MGRRQGEWLDRPATEGNLGFKQKRGQKKTNRNVQTKQVRLNIQIDENKKG
ncbi:hypothetical protein RSAG8_06639, partial [Rhizoctonia solani AG-8 WAC10335]